MGSMRLISVALDPYPGAGGDRWHACRSQRPSNDNPEQSRASRSRWTEALARTPPRLAQRP